MTDRAKAWTAHENVQLLFKLGDMLAAGEFDPRLADALTDCLTGPAWDRLQVEASRLHWQSSRSESSTTKRSGNVILADFRRTP